METIPKAIKIEGQTMNKPPMFKGQNYDYWKQRMMTFFDSCHIDMWDIVENDNYIPTNKEGAEIPRSLWNKEQKTRYLLNSKARNFLMCTLTESEYEKVHNCKSSKEIWDTFALAYEGMSQVRNSKISMLVHKYELFKMEDNETINLVFGKFQIIISNLRSLGKTYDNYDHITKILRTLRASKDLKKLPMEELLGMLKFIALKAHKAPKGLTSKAFKAEESCGDTLNEDCSDEDEFSFISRKIQSMWKHKRGSRWKNNFSNHTKETKDKTRVVCYECKKSRHFKSECSNLEKEEDKEKKKPFIKKKKNPVTTWEDFDLSSSEDEEEGVNLCLMVDTSSEDENDEEINFNNLEYLQIAYQELLLKFINSFYRIQRTKTKIFKTVQRF
ncbi:hypothetical protein CR513_56560, partial [Mucuna pruriens]